MPKTMSVASRQDAATPPEPEPTWEIAHLFPPQGMWTEEEYLALRANRLVEFVGGRVEVLPMPTALHQLIVAFLYRTLRDWVSPRRLGTVLFSPMPVLLQAGKYREPDILFKRAESAFAPGDAFWSGADLVMEVVSADDPQRDWQVKRAEYAQAGIPEYWIIDPHQGCITVFILEGGEYREHGVFTRGERATSLLLPGFGVDVSAAVAGEP